MGDRSREDIKALFGRFFDADEAEAAGEDMRAGEQIFRTHGAPAPDGELVDFIKVQLAARLARRRRLALAYRGFAAAAAVIVVAVIALLGRGPAPPDSPNVTYASIMPTAVWESDDVTADDFELIYFDSEIQRIEAEIRALESGEVNVAPAGSVEEIELELIQIKAEFWKG